jgi:ABC-type transporter Mla MlaB component
VAGPAQAAQKSTRPATVELEIEQTLSNATAMHARLASLVGHPAQVTIDAAATQRIDAAVLQLLCAFVRDRRARNLQTGWHDPGRVIGRAAQRIGLQALVHFESRAA